MKRNTHRRFAWLGAVTLLIVSSLLASCGGTKLSSGSTSQTSQKIPTKIEIKNSDEISFSNTLWDIRMNPSTQKVWANLPTGGEIVLSGAGEAYNIQNLRTEGDKALWTQVGTGREVEVSLMGDQLALTWTPSQEGEMSFPILEASEDLKSYLLPLREGIRIEPKDSAWLANLADEKEWEMTESMSMPAFLLEYGNHGISYLFADNPFNNTVEFQTNRGQIDLSVKHESTPLAIEPYQVLISLEEPNWLAGSKRYRDWLEERGEFIPLKEKIAQAKDGEKLIGAVHTYVWGTYLLGEKDIKDWKGFIGALKTNPAWRDNLNAEAQEFLTLDRNLYAYERGALLTAFEEALFVRQGGRKAEDYQARRALVEKELGTYLTPSDTWGNGLTTGFVEQFNNAGIDRALLLSTEPWIAYYHPEAVKLGQKLGYLMGSYDSYDTALPEGFNDSWGSAQLGEKAYKTMGIIKRDGVARKGFGGNGVYLNAGVMQPLLEERVTAIQEVNGYNAWFLDVSAAGMLFEDYDPSKLTNKRQDLENRVNNMAWVAKNLKVLVGSEDGVAIASSPIAYAHGMHSMGFGWGDRDLRRDKDSPFYLGRYYPDDNPSYFFKSVPLKDKYAELYFNPKTRVPLYQALMNDSMITTTHWEKDSLKFKNGQAFEELSQQLYNIAPLLSLGQPSAKTRLPYLKKIYDFFSPVHKELAYESLDSFRWLDADGMVQETGFSDGSRIVANFSDKAVEAEGETIPALTVVAHLASGKTLSYKAQV